MSQLKWKRIDELYEQALALNPSERAGFLDKACAGDTAIRTKLDELLRAHGAAEDGFLDRLARTVKAESLVTFVFPPGTRLLGRYTVCHRVGAGGMAEVYQVREDGFDRDLAIKVIKPELHGLAEAEWRFLAEARLTSQLQHPNIVPVHNMGRLEDGRLYFTMQLVLGETLKTWLSDGTRFPNPEIRRSELLRVFERLCDALAFAHERGVVHRDLKPENVMIGALGVVQLMDWGIAKGPRPAWGPLPATLHPEVQLLRQAGQGRTLDLTDAGRVLGTLSYMAPEQARGELVDERCDVFGLGAILYEVLTGQPLYTAETTEDSDATTRIRRQVKLGELEPAYARLDACRADPGCRADPELISLAKECLQQNRDRRPRNAGEVARRVTAHLTGLEQKRQQADRDRAAADARADEEKRTRLEAERRAKAEEQARQQAEARANFERRAYRRAVLSALTLVILAAVGFGWALREKNNAEQQQSLRIQADEQRNQALQNLRVARQAVQQYCVRISRDHRLRQYDLEKLRKELLEPAVTFLEAFATQHGDDPELQFERAQAYGLLGEITAELTSGADALEHHRKARDLFESLASTHPHEARYQKYLALSWEHMGTRHRAAHEFKEAEAAHKQALEIRARLSKVYPRTAEYLRAEAMSHGNLANLYDHTGRIDETDIAYSEALRLFQEAAEAAPNIPEYEQDLAAAHNNIGIFLWRRSRKHDRLTLAEKSLLSALEARKGLATKYPQDDSCQDQLAGSHNNLGNFYAETSRPDKAKDHYGQAVVLQRELARRHPTILSYQRQLSRTLSNMARDTGEDTREETEKVFQEAIEIQRRLTEDHPAMPAFKNDLAITQSNLGNWYWNHQQVGLAEEACRTAVGLGVELTSRFSKIPDYRVQLGKSRSNLANVLTARGKKPEAEAEYVASLADREALVKAFPNVPEYEFDLATIHSNLGAFYLENGDKNKAERHSREAVKIGAEIAGRYNVPEYRQRLSEARNNLANCYYAGRRMEDAIAEYQEVIRLREKLAEELHDPEYKHLLAKSQNNLGLALSHVMGREQEAKSAFKVSIKVLTKLVDEYPEAPRYRHTLAQNHTNLGTFYARNSVMELAEAEFLSAYKQGKHLVPKHAEVPEYAISFGLTCVNLASAMENLKKPEAALELFEEAVRVLEPLHRNNTVKERLRKAYSYRALFLSRLRRHKEALSDWEKAIELAEGRQRELLRLEWGISLAFTREFSRATAIAEDLAKTARKAKDGLLFHGAGAIYASCVEAVPDQAAKDEKDREKEATEYGTRSVDLLREAHKVGYYDLPTGAARLMGDQRLDAVRSREDFKQLANEVKRRAKQKTK